MNKYILFFISGLFITMPYAYGMRAALRVASRVASASTQATIHGAAVKSCI